MALAVYAAVVTVLLVIAVAFLIVLVQDGRKIALNAAQRMVDDRDSGEVPVLVLVLAAVVLFWIAFGAYA